LKKLNQIDVIDLLPEIDELLIQLLENLSLKDWASQTITPKWKVKDVAVHLLDGNLRTLSMLRDNYYGEKAESINSYSDLVEFLNKLNPDEKAEFSVAWAGEDESKNWFYIAREYTEKWHHQQQIRFAVGKEKVLLANKYFYPYLDTSIRALPYHYRNISANNNDIIKFTFKGITDKNWFLRFSNNWELFKKIDGQPICEVVIKDEFAWRIFTKGISKEEAIQQSEIIGNLDIRLKIFDMIAVMA